MAFAVAYKTGARNFKMRPHEWQQTEHEFPSGQRDHQFEERRERYKYCMSWWYKEAESHTGRDMPNIRKELKQKFPWMNSTIVGTFYGLSGGRYPNNNPNWDAERQLAIDWGLEFDSNGEGVGVPVRYPQVQVDKLGGRFTIEKCSMIYPVPPPEDDWHCQTRNRLLKWYRGYTGPWNADKVVAYLEGLREEEFKKKEKLLHRQPLHRQPLHHDMRISAQKTIKKLVDSKDMTDLCPLFYNHPVLPTNGDLFPIVLKYLMPEDEHDRYQRACKAITTANKNQAIVQANYVKSVARRHLNDPKI